MNASLDRFNAAASRSRAGLFSGPVTPAGRNIQIGSRKLCLAFARLNQIMELEAHGRRWRCSASIRIPLSLGLTVDERTVITHLPTGEKYDVVQLDDHPAMGELRVLLHRQED